MKVLNSLHFDKCGVVVYYPLESLFSFFVECTHVKLNDYVIAMMFTFSGIIFICHLFYLKNCLEGSNACELAILLAEIDLDFDHSVP